MHDHLPMQSEGSSGAATTPLPQEPSCNYADARWRKRDPVVVPHDFRGKPFTEVEELQSPFEYFKSFFDDRLIEHISEQTNLYHTQEALSKGLKDNFVSTDKEEIEQFIGILLYMGIYPNPQYRMYWSPATNIPQITRALKGGVNRFEILKRFLHFNDNSCMPKRNSLQFDKLYKVRPVVESVLGKCQKVEPEEYNSIDEQMIPSKSKSPLRQYMPKKPHKWGYKVFTRCGNSGIIYDFEIYTGKSSSSDKPSYLGITGDLVMRLCTHLPKHENFKTYFDNFFTSLPLLRELKLQGILAVGTIRQNRMAGAQKILESEKSLKSRGRGSYDWRVDASSNTIVVRWQDNSTVQLASTFVSHELGEPVKRWSGKDNRHIDITCPRIVHEYNKFMGGVDLCDMLLSLYRIKLKSNKWYMAIFYYLVKVAVTNGWLLYRRHHSIINRSSKKSKSMTLLEFQTSIANDLTLCGKLPTVLAVRRGRPSETPTPPKRSKTTAAVGIPKENYRYDYLGHFPEFVEKKHRCRLCPKGFTFVQCCKCKISLCFIKERNCFMKFHVK